MIFAGQKNILEFVQAHTSDPLMEFCWGLNFAGATKICEQKSTQMKLNFQELMQT
jgi:hypothetical protein